MCYVLAFAAAAAAISGASAYSSSKTAKAQAKYQSAVARNNKQVAVWQADDALARGRETERQHRQRVGQLTGLQTVSLAGQGVDVTTGSSVDLLADTAAAAEFDAQTIRANTEREAFSFQTQANNFEADARLLTSTADNINPFLNSGLAAGQSFASSSAGGGVSSSWFASNTGTSSNFKN